MLNWCKSIFRWGDNERKKNLSWDWSSRRVIKVVPCWSRHLIFLRMLNLGHVKHCPWYEISIISSYKRFVPIIHIYDDRRDFWEIEGFKLSIKGLVKERVEVIPDCFGAVAVCLVDNLNKWVGAAIVISGRQVTSLPYQNAHFQNVGPSALGWLPFRVI